VVSSGPVRAGAFSLCLLVGVALHAFRVRLRAFLQAAMFGLALSLVGCVTQYEGACIQGTVITNKTLGHSGYRLQVPEGFVVDRVGDHSSENTIGAMARYQKSVYGLSGSAAKLVDRLEFYHDTKPIRVYFQAAVFDRMPHGSSFYRANTRRANEAEWIEMELAGKQSYLRKQVTPHSTGDYTQVDVSVIGYLNDIYEFKVSGNGHPDEIAHVATQFARSLSVD